jgi:glycosyltransferase involved in cell wall biosynthesis
MQSLSISFCTRNRQADLERAIVSVMRQAPLAQPDREIELLLVDDGELPGDYIASVERRCVDAGWMFRYHNKRARGGLYKSRLETFAIARGDVVLFFDDDVEVESGYLDRLLAHYDSDPRLTGLGGVDSLQLGTPTWRVLYELLIGFRSLSPGRLSMSTYGGSMDWWARQPGPFDCEFLYGCNMSYRASAMRAMGPVALFEGHSSAEDLYLSWFARRSGVVQIDPALRVQHHQSPLARDRMEAVFSRQVTNHAGLVDLTGGGVLHKLLVLYTATGLVLLAALKAAVRLARSRDTRSFGQVKGGLHGIRTVLRSMR